ncbi:MAG: hypothetical protein MZV64_11615 [Ignavibacteriales bacterium]|nr:hypothetical protein [Ignavibacteriales bacterium]
MLLGSAVRSRSARSSASWLSGLRQQRLRADRPGDADRPGGEERDPDRRVRQGRSTKRACRSIEAALESARLRFRPILMTALRLHPRRCATGHGGRRRLCKPSCPRNLGFRRDARGHHLRRHGRPGTLCRFPETRRQTEREKAGST